MPDSAANTAHSCATCASGAEVTTQAYIIDSACRSLGYSAVVRKRQGAVNVGGNHGGFGGQHKNEYLSVPALLQNCADLLALVEAGNAKFMEAQQNQSTACANAASSEAMSKTPSMADAKPSTPKSTRISRLKRFFHSSFRRQEAEKTTAKGEKAVEAVSGVNDSRNSAGDWAENGTEISNADPEPATTASSLQQMLADVRDGAEKLFAQATGIGDVNADSSLPITSNLTPLQREVLYFQVRWPQIIQVVSEKLEEAEFSVGRLLETSELRGRAEASARARGAARMASMEAELLRLRNEIRRCGRHRLGAQKSSTMPVRRGGRDGGLDAPMKSMASIQMVAAKRELEQITRQPESAPDVVAIVDVGLGDTSKSDAAFVADESNNDVS